MSRDFRVLAVIFKSSQLILVLMYSSVIGEFVSDGIVRFCFSVFE